MKEQDRGTYSCVVVNKMGKATCSAKLLVQGQVQPAAKPAAPIAGLQAPQLIQPMRDQFVDEGSPTTFACKIVANPPPVIQVAHCFASVWQVVWFSVCTNANQLKRSLQMFFVLNFNVLRDQVIWVWTTVSSSRNKISVRKLESSHAMLLLWLHS